MSLARAVPFQDEFLVSDIGAEYRPQSAESAKGLVADAALKIYDQTPVRLPPRGQCVSKNPVKFNAVLHRPQHDDGATSVSAKIYSGTISERAKSALERRLRPHTTLSCYELAYALRISESTLWALLSGNSKSGPSGRVLQKLVGFFGAPFLQEVFGGPNVHCFDPRDAQKAAALRKLAEAQEELRRLG